MQKCSYCGKENSDGVAKCGECGVALTAHVADVEASESDGVENPRIAHGRKLMLRGAVWFVGGLAVTLFSYLQAVSSPHGGQYIIAYGAVIVGLVQFFRGRAAASGTENSEEARALLEEAAELESVDQAKAEALYAEIVRKFPNTRACKEAQRNMQTLSSHRQ